MLNIVAVTYFFTFHELGKFFFVALDMGLVTSKNIIASYFNKICLHSE